MSEPLADEIYGSVFFEAMKTFILAARNLDLHRARVGDATTELPVTTELRLAIRKATEQLNDVEKIAPEIGGEDIREYLASSECAQIAAALFVSRSSTQGMSNEVARKSFCAGARYYCGDNSELSDAGLNGLFDVLVACVNDLLLTQIGDSTSAALDARDEFRQRLIEDRLDGLEKLTASVTAQHLPTREEVESFVDLLRRSVAKVEGTVLLPSHKERDTRRINEVFVNPTLETISSPVGKLGERSVADVLPEEQRLVVLGDPGGGKSTLTQKLCYDICSEKRSSRRVAFRVVMRDAFRTSNPTSVSLFEFLRDLVKTRYQLKPVSDETIEYLLRSGRSTVVFDGLDEVVNLADRRIAASSIEAFADAYPETRVLVTSREIGYEQARLDTNSFGVGRLSPFDETATRLFIRLWFRAHGVTQEHELDAICDEMFTHSAQIEELRTNPLMLGLICSLYKGENSIPSSRPRVFEKCSEMLFSRWDVDRKVVEPLKIAHRLRPAIDEIAEWIYFDASYASGVTESALLEKASAYFEEWSDDDPLRAKQAAVEFIDLCKGRAWVFTNMGTSPSGDELFQFTHRVFLEYFASESLVAEAPTAELLYARLRGLIQRRESSVLTQLSLQCLGRHSPRPVDEFLELTLNEVESVNWSDPEDSRAAVAALAFAVESLSYVAPSPRMVRRIVRMLLDVSARSFEALRNQATAYRRFDASDDVLLQAFRALLQVGVESRDIAIRGTNEWLTGALQSRDTQAMAASAIFGIETLAGAFTGRSDWLQAIDELTGSVRPQLLALAKSDKRVALNLYHSDRIDLGFLLGCVGLEDLFSGFQYEFAPNIGRPAVATWAVLECLTQGDEELKTMKGQKALEEIGALVLDMKLPMNIRVDDDLSIRRWGHLQLPVENVSDDVLFGIFVTLAVDAERLEIRGEPDSPHFQLVGNDDTFNHLVELVGGRGRQPGMRVKLANELFQNSRQSSLARDWILEEKSFVSI